MASKLGTVGDLKVVKKTSIGHILENGCIIEDTFAETCHLIVMTHSVSGQTSLFFC